jgi:hypothetical protein
MSSIIMVCKAINTGQNGEKKFDSAEKAEQIDKWSNCRGEKGGSVL